MDKMPFKDISYLELWQPFCSEPIVNEEQFCEIILNKWVRRCHLKDFLSGVLAALLFGGVNPFMQF